MYAIAIWNYCREDSKLPVWIHEFADQGFDTISFNTGLFTRISSEHLRAANAAMEERNLMATAHGSSAMTKDAMEATLNALGDRLYAFTMDPVKREDSRGTLYDGRKMAEALATVLDLTDGTNIKVAIEDFPLDDLALTYYQSEFSGLYSHQRAGILIDVGHMHMRMKRSPYFSSLSIEEYFRRLPCPLVEVHVHDNHGLKDEHGHLGLGTVPFAEVAAALTKVNFRGVSTIEIAPSFHGSTPEESKPRAFESLRLWKALFTTVNQQGS